MGRHFGGRGGGHGGGHHGGHHHGPHHHHHGPHHHHHGGWGWRRRPYRGCCGCWTLILAGLGIGAVVLLSLLFLF